MTNRLHPLRCRSTPAVALAAAILLLLAAAPAGAQDDPDREPPSQIQPGERLRISVLGFSAPDAESWFVRRLNEQSRLELPIVGEVDASGISRFQLETKIADAYNRSVFRSRPIIAISRLDYGEDHVLIPAVDAAAARRLRDNPRREEPMGRGEAAEAPGAPAVTQGEGFQEDLNLLNRPLPEPLALEQTTLEEAVVRLSEAADAEIFVHWAELERHEVSRETPVNVVTPAGASLTTAMQLLSRSAREADAKQNTMPLDFTADNGVIILSTEDDLRRDVQTVVLDIRHLVGIPKNRGADAILPRQRDAANKLHDEITSDVISLIQDLVEPHAWKDNGGSVGAISTLNGQLVVTATPDMLEEVRQVLRKLEEGR